MAWIALLLALGGAPSSAQDAATAGATDAADQSDVMDAAWSSPDVAAPRMESRPLRRAREQSVQPAADRSAPRRQGSWVRTTAALGGVVALIVLLAWGYRAATSGGGRIGSALRGGRGNLIEVVGRTSLAPRQSLCLVRIGSRLVLLGLTTDAVRALDVIDDAELVARLLGQAARERPDSHTAEFQRCLEQEARAPERDADMLDETVTPDAARILNIRETLAGTLERLRARASGA